MNGKKEMTTTGYWANRYKTVPSLKFLRQTCFISYGSLKRMSYIKSAIWSDEMKQGLEYDGSWAYQGQQWRHRFLQYCLQCKLSYHSSIEFSPIWLLLNNGIGILLRRHQGLRVSVWCVGMRCRWRLVHKTCNLYRILAWTTIISICKEWK